MKSTDTDATFYRLSPGEKSSGYSGQIEILVLLSMTPELKDLLFSKVAMFSKIDQRKIREFIKSSQKPGLFERAMEKVLSGELFIEDVLSRMVY